MRIIDAIPLIEAFVDSDVPVLLRGPSGVGKSDLVRQLAAKRGWYCVDKFRASTIDPVDMRGVPSVTDGRTQCVNAGAKMRRRAGVKMHQRRRRNGALGRPCGV
jgi:MoxR-like ATPase